MAVRVEEQLCGSDVHGAWGILLDSDAEGVLTGGLGQLDDWGAGDRAL